MKLAPRALATRLPARGLAHARARRGRGSAPSNLFERCARRDTRRSLLNFLEDVIGRRRAPSRPGSGLLGRRPWCHGIDKHPVEIVATRRSPRLLIGLHRPSALSSAPPCFAGLLGKLRRGDLFLSSATSFALLAVAQLLLNGLHLLIQVELALGALHLRLHAGLDLLLDLQETDISPCIRP